MLKMRGDILDNDAGRSGGAARTSASLSDLVRVLRYQSWTIAGITALFVICAAAYAMGAERIYKASASLLIDVSREDPLHKDRRADDAQVETVAIESQVQIMLSEAVTAEVVRSLRLTEDPEFVGDQSWLPARLLREAVDLIVGTGRDESGPDDLEQTAIHRLIDSVSTSRLGRTYVVSVSAVSRDPAKAAQIANAIARAYTDDQFNARSAAAERSAEWLKKRAAELRQQSLEADRAVQNFTSRGGDRERSELKSLETTAQTYRTLYENFLSQYATTVQQLTFPITFARVITPATPPKRKSYPRTTLLLLGALVGGSGIGWLVGFARETIGRRIHSEQDVQEVTQLSSIGPLPKIRHKWPGAYRPQKAQPGGVKAAGVSNAGRLLVGQSDAMMQIARLYPRSRFAETIKTIKASIALEPSRDIRTIGVISARRGEGKTILAANLAQHLASLGHRTILLDWNFQSPTLTEATPLARPLDAARSGDEIAVDAGSGLAFQPVSGAQRGAGLAEALTVPGFQARANALADRYEYVVVDLPCLDTAIDARAVSSLVDCCVLVCAADELPADELRRAAERWRSAGLGPILGFVLNRTSTSRKSEPLATPPAPRAVRQPMPKLERAA